MTDVQAGDMRIAFESSRALAIGAAGEHIVCADLLLQGHRASIAAAQLSYDVVLDADGKLLRVAVKATTGARVRPARTGSRPCYQFCITRTKAGNKRYTALDVDIVALVALDIRRVAYLAISETTTIQHIDSPHHPMGTNKFGPKRNVRKRFDDFPLRSAISLVLP